MRDTDIVGTYKNKQVIIIYIFIDLKKKTLREMAISYNLYMNLPY